MYEFPLKTLYNRNPPNRELEIQVPEYKFKFKWHQNLILREDYSHNDTPDIMWESRLW